MTTYSLNNVSIYDNNRYVNDNIIEALVKLTSAVGVEGKPRDDSSSKSYDGDEPPKYDKVPLDEFVFWLFNYHANITFTNPAKQLGASREATEKDLTHKVEQYFTFEGGPGNEVINSDYHFECSGEVTLGLDLRVSQELIKAINITHEQATDGQAMINKDYLLNNLKLQPVRTTNATKLTEYFNENKQNFVYIAAIKVARTGVGEIFGRSYYNINNETKTWLMTQPENGLVVTLIISNNLKEKSKVKINKTTPEINSNIYEIKDGIVSLQFKEAAAAAADEEYVFKVDGSDTAKNIYNNLNNNNNNYYLNKSFIAPPSATTHDQASWRIIQIEEVFLPHPAATINNTDPNEMIKKHLQSFVDILNERNKLELKDDADPSVAAEAAEARVVEESVAAEEARVARAAMATDEKGFKRVLKELAKEDKEVKAKAKKAAEKKRKEEDKEVKAKAKKADDKSRKSTKKKVVKNKNKEGDFDSIWDMPNPLTDDD